MEGRTHINLAVRDLDKSVDFYSKIFSGKPNWESRTVASFFLERPSLHLTLNEEPSGETSLPKNTHHGIEFPSEESLSVWIEAMKAKGVQFREEKFGGCCSFMYWATDPDGREWEFYTPTEKPKFTGSVLIDGEASSCCG